MGLHQRRAIATVGFTDSSLLQSASPVPWIPVNALSHLCRCPEGSMEQGVSSAAFRLNTILLPPVWAYILLYMPE